MKKLFFILLLVLIPVIAKAQTSNLYHYKEAVTAGDTLYTKGTASVVGGWLERVVVSNPVASDTIILNNGKGVVDTILIGATVPAPFTQHYGCRLDTSLILVKKGLSGVAVIYGKRY